LYFYLRKEINEEAPEFSNKTFNFISSDNPISSIGLSHRMGFPQYHLGVNIELVHFEYVYNDVWLDYTRSAGIAGSEYEFIPTIKLALMAGYYQDTFVVEPLKQGDCKFVKQSASQPAQIPQRCPREDDGTIYQVALHWNYSEFTRFSLKY